MALPTQGLGLVGTSIIRNGITFASHLQFINWSNQHEIEIDNDIAPQDWSFRVDAVDPATFNRPASDYANTGAIDLGGRLAENVWALAIQATNSMDAAGLTYELLTQNSNSFINSLMLSLGININSYLSTATPQNDGLGFVGVGTDVRDKVVFTISGTNGDDWFFSGAKNDVLYGGNGNDFYFGGGGGDVIGMGAGNDWVEGGAAADTIFGGDDTDTLAYTGSSAAVTIYLSSNYAAGGDAQGDIVGNFESVAGSNAGNDLLVGSSAANTLMGQAGADWLYGLDGRDFLIGGMGSDILVGGAGSDYYYGGSGGEADYSYVLQADITAGDVDYLMDFAAASGDYVLLPAAVRANTFFASYAGYALGYVLTGGGGYYAFVAINNSAADLQTHTYFF